jgi:predicted  nucleic acid-binding Zn-ribbon protein
MTEQELLKLKNEIDDAKSSVSELKGQMTVLMKQLKDEYKCNSIEDAEVLLTKWEKEVTKIQQQIDKGIEELEEKYKEHEEE